MLPSNLPSDGPFRDVTHISPRRKARVFHSYAGLLPCWGQNELHFALNGLLNVQVAVITGLEPLAVGLLGALGRVERSQWGERDTNVDVPSGR